MMNGPDTTVEDAAIRQQPFVTALICNYNYGRFLGEAIDSALDQSWQHLEVIVVDDGSTDESRQILARYGSRIRVILKENEGQASAFNVGICAAHGEIICFLDSDDSWEKDKVARVVDKYRQASWGLVCHDLALVDANGAAIDGKGWCEFESVTLAEGNIFDAVVTGGFPWVFSPTSGMSLRTSIARGLLPLPERDWRICADTPLAYAAICDGPVGVVSGQLGKYRLHGKNGFGPVNGDPIRARIMSIVHPVQRYLFLQDYFRRRGSVLLATPTEDYAYRRRVRMIATDRPWRALPELWRSNLESMPQNWWNARFLILDPLLALAIELRLPIAHRRIREKFLEYSSQIDSRTLAYLQCTDDERPQKP